MIYPSLELKAWFEARGEFGSVGDFKPQVAGPASRPDPAFGFGVARPRLSITPPPTEPKAGALRLKLALTGTNIQTLKLS